MYFYFFKIFFAYQISVKVKKLSTTTSQIFDLLLLIRWPQDIGASFNDNLGHGLALPDFMLSSGQWKALQMYLEQKLRPWCLWGQSSRQYMLAHCYLHGKMHDKVIGNSENMRSLVVDLVKCFYFVRQLNVLFLLLRMFITKNFLHRGCWREKILKK